MEIQFEVLRGALAAPEALVRAVELARRRRCMVQQLCSCSLVCFDTLLVNNDKDDTLYLRRNCSLLCSCRRCMVQLLVFVYCDLCLHTPYFCPYPFTGKIVFLWFAPTHFRYLSLFFYRKHCSLLNCDLCQHTPYFCPCPFIGKNYHLWFVLTLHELW